MEMVPTSKWNNSLQQYLWNTEKSCMWGMDETCVSVNLSQLFYQIWKERKISPGMKENETPCHKN